MDYSEVLEDSAKQTGSIVCMGLDPVVEAMPDKYKEKGISGFEAVLMQLIEEKFFQVLLNLIMVFILGMILRFTLMRKIRGL